QIDLIQEIENQGFTYKTSDGIYFDVVAYENAGNTYGTLSTLDQRKEGARVEKNPERKDPRDFALWKFSPEEEQRDMEWKSPWGKGFPGWHIECSAMSMKYLGEQFDIHIGGEDLRSTHHPNEVAQSEAATNKHPFVKYWMHGSFLLVDDGRMGKSLGNAYALHDIRERGFSPLALRYFYLTGHYRKQLNFTWEALEAASNALGHLYEVMRALPDTTSIDDKYQNAFKAVVNDDLNMPQALAVVWDLLGDTSVDPGSKKATLIDFDKVLGFNLGEQEEIDIAVPEEIGKLVEEREKARENKDFDTADEIRESIEKQGYTVTDAEDSPKIRKIKKN
ncbi:MAG: cysteine--tRNA ligase, partial [Candidatus Paceibacterota bacterium]